MTARKHKLNLGTKRIKQATRQRQMELARRAAKAAAIAAEKANHASRLATVPEDTRTLTGRICGDPLPGRRAIDMVRA